MARFCTLCSSSSGNSSYIGTGNGGILIDAGTNAKQLTLALESISVNPETIHGIFITHEHTDHIGALRVFASRYHIPVFATKGTLNAMEKGGHLKGDFTAEIMTPDGVDVNGMLVKSFRTSHDSAESCGYTVLLPDETKISVCTDTGIITQDVIDKVTGSDLILLESNHDKKMLNDGPYPYYLKQRVLGCQGHLSNELSGRLLCQILHPNLKHIILGHLSRENNFPELAYETVKLEVTMSDVPFDGNQLPLMVANRDKMSNIIHV